MSLLNNMLADLERDGSKRTCELKNGIVLEHAAEDASSLRFFTTVISAVAFVFLCYVLWQQFVVPETDASAEPFVTQQITAQQQRPLSVLEYKAQEPLLLLAQTTRFLQNHTAKSVGWFVHASGLEVDLSLQSTPAVDKYASLQAPPVELEQASEHISDSEEVQAPVRVTKQNNESSREQSQHLQITRSSRSLDMEAVSRARALVVKGESASAETVLLAELESNSEAIVSVQLLADLYFDRAAETELAWLASNTRFADNSLRAYVLARHYALSKDNAQALTLLIEVKPHSLIEEAYLALQAGLYHQTAAYADAEKLYARLLAKNNRSLSLWLGYALASDANNRYEQALGAYRQVLRLPDLNISIKNYVQGRVDMLSATNLTASTMEPGR